MSENSANPPLVSVVLPVYNGEKYLRESLDSLLNQTYTRVEIIVIDDASTDDSAYIISSYGECVQSHRNQENLGIYGSMNAGILLATGEYIAIYHADDIYEPNIIELEVKFLDTYSEAGIVFCMDIFVDEQGKEYDRLRLQPEVQGGRPLNYQTVLNALLLYRNRFIRCPSCMARSVVYNDVGLYAPEKFFNTSDLEMYLRISEKYRLGIVEEYLFRYRHTPGQSSTRYHNLRTDEERFFTIMDLYLQKNGKSVASLKALAAYEAHRSEDQLMRVISLYILNRLSESKDLLSELRPGCLVASRRVQRFRLICLYSVMFILVRTPRIALISNFFRRRWHSK